MKNTKIVALVAAVALLVLGTAFASFAASYNWYEQDGEWRCADKNGEDYYDAWAKSGDGWYWLGDDGYMVRESLVDDGNKYVGADGKMVTNQWIKVTDDDNNDHWMYFQSGGKKLVGKDTGAKPVSIGDKKYIFNQDGYMMSGWVEEDYDNTSDEDYAWQTGVWYCGDDEDGAVKYGWQQIECYNEAEDFYDNNYWFYFATNGKKVKAKEGTLTQKTINGKGYAFDDCGVMKAEWEAVYATEATASNSDVTKYAWFQSAEIGAKFANGWFKVVPSANFDETSNSDDTSKWFYAKSGKLAKNTIKTINSKKYGFNNAGEMVVGLCAVTYDPTDSSYTFVEENIDDAGVMNKYIDEEYIMMYFSNNEDEDGSLKTGAQTVKVDGDDYNFYFDTANSTKGYGIKGYKNNKYYFSGIKVTADDTYADYQLFEINYIDDVNKKAPYVNRIATAEADLAKTEIKPVDALYAVDATKYELISKTGIVSKSGTKKDNNGRKYVFSKKGTECTTYGAWIVYLD